MVKVNANKLLRGARPAPNKIKKKKGACATKRGGKFTSKKVAPSPRKPRAKEPTAKTNKVINKREGKTDIFEHVDRSNPKAVLEHLAKIKYNTTNTDFYIRAFERKAGESFDLVKKLMEHIQQMSDKQPGKQKALIALLCLVYHLEAIKIRKEESHKVIDKKSNKVTTLKKWLETPGRRHLLTQSVRIRLSSLKKTALGSTDLITKVTKKSLIKDLASAAKLIQTPVQRAERKTKKSRREWQRLNKEKLQNDLHEDGLFDMRGEPKKHVTLIAKIRYNMRKRQNGIILNMQEIRQEPTRRTPRKVNAFKKRLKEARFSSMGTERVNDSLNGLKQEFNQLRIEYANV